MSEATNSPVDPVEEHSTPAPTAIALLAPENGVPQIVDSESLFERALAELAQGSGPFAVDAERASGFKFSARAYLIQIKRHNGGLHLIDPIPFGPGHNLFNELNQLLQSDACVAPFLRSDEPCYHAGSQSQIRYLYHR